MTHSSHTAMLNDKLTPALQRGLQKYNKPWYQARSMRVFRDQTDLAAHPDLWGSIKKALSVSRWFVLMASPRAARSKWVRKEVDWWLTNRSEKSIIVALTSGQLATCEDTPLVGGDSNAALPSALGSAMEVEPIWVDLRGLRNMTHRRFQPDPVRVHSQNCLTDLRNSVSPASGRTRQATPKNDAASSRCRCRPGCPVRCDVHRSGRYRPTTRRDYAATTHRDGTSSDS